MCFVCFTVELSARPQLTLFITPFVDKLCYSKHLVSFDGLATLGLQIAHLHKIYFIEPFTRAIATSRIRIRVNVTPPMNLVYSLCCQVFAIFEFLRQDTTFMSTHTHKIFLFPKKLSTHSDQRFVKNEREREKNQSQVVNISQIHIN